MASVGNLPPEPRSWAAFKRSGKRLLDFRLACIESEKEFLDAPVTSNDGAVTAGPSSYFSLVSIL